MELDETAPWRPNPALTRLRNGANRINILPDPSPAEHDSRGNVGTDPVEALRRPMSLGQVLPRKVLGRKHVAAALDLAVKAPVGAQARQREALWDAEGEVESSHASLPFSVGKVQIHSQVRRNSRD